MDCIYGSIKLAYKLKNDGKSLNIDEKFSFTRKQKIDRDNVMKQIIAASRK